MTTSSVSVTEGSGKNLATHAISEDAVTKQVSRVALNESDGSEVSLSAKLGALTEAAPGSDTASSGLNGRLQRIAQRLTSLIALLPAALGAGGGLKVDGSGTALPISAASGALVDGAVATIGAKADAKSTATDTTAISAMSVWKQISASVQALVTSITVASQGYKSAQTITRPANTTAYAAADVLGGAITFSNIAPAAGGEILITSVELEADIASIPSGMVGWYLYLYSVTPPSAVADNGAFDIPAGDRASFLGKIAIGTLVDEGSTLYVRSDGVNAQVSAAGSSIFGYLVVGSAGFTPANNSEVYKITLHATAL